ncbi:hypothetical protein B0H16DRAFT_1736843 [Mycena metata]|uniref:RING-type domain-containing protein n=1 Tax=Mycena metata TaxID=1033252 RepID=A0AAD7HMX8_9AGAR|nr:hypothetical protein B0H16DRAFT_1736843 [Mycena metata]
MQHPSVRLVQTNLFRYFRTASPVTTAATGHAAGGGTPATQSLVTTSTFAPGVGNTLARPIDVDLWIANRDFGDEEGLDIAAAIDVDAWLARRASIEETDVADNPVGAAEPETVTAHATVQDGDLEAEPVQRGLFLCSICFEAFNRPVVTLCAHIFCDACLTENFKYSMACPLCRSAITEPPMRDRLFEVELSQAVAAGVIAEPEGAGRESPYTWPSALFR